jgi:hypothetical protein
MLLTGQEMSFVDRYLPYFRQWLITCPLLALLPFQPLLTESSCGDQVLALPPFSSALSASPSLCCVLVFSSLFIVQFFFFPGASICPGGYAGLSQGWLGEYCVMLGAHLLVFLKVSKAGLDPACGTVAALLFS